jgi:putative ATP-dependent endonuclease of OLD family
MFLKSVKIKNFRKFYKCDENIEFVSGKNINNISNVTTLIIGKNNVGKSTIIEFFKKLENGKFNANDFNFIYLQEILEQYKNNNFENTPIIESEIKVFLDNEEAMIGAIADFLPISENVEEIEIKIKYKLVEEDEFKERVKEVLKTKDEYKKDEYKQFNNFLKLINECEFKIEIFRSNDTKVEKFKFSDLFELKVISANKPVESNTLSNAFKKIIQFKYENESKSDIENHIDYINSIITNDIAEEYINIVNNAFGTINNNQKYKMHLNGNVSFEDLFKNLIRYEYIEGNIHIPESQFGLGYKNLMIIISEIIDFVQKYPNEEQSKINLIFIEEPENYMHPQMQEMFIKYINDAISCILKDSNKSINSQLIIITHSSHIVNSKIHYADSFNNIVYLYENKDGLLKISNLKDNNIVEDNSFLPFLKKHIKFEVSNIFFADGVIVVEGLVEEIILKYFLENHKLKNYYITIFKIDGAHAFKYDKLFKLLNIPVLIITDLDIKREKNEEKIKDNANISNLENKNTTNGTLKHYYNTDNIAELQKRFKELDKNNIYIATQIKPIEGYYATSFEEAFVLTNWDNDILKDVLKEIKPQKIKEIIDDNENKENLKHNSYKIQEMLNKSKGDFAIKLLEKMIEIDNHNIILPDYINYGLEWLLKELQG